MVRNLSDGDRSDGGLGDTQTIKRRGRNLTLGIAAAVVAFVMVAVVAFAAYDGAADAQREVDAEEHRANRANTESLVIGCKQVNGLADSLIALANTRGQSPLTGELIDSIQDPELRRVLDAVASQSLANERAFQDAVSDVQKLDCDAIRRRVARSRTGGG